MSLKSLRRALTGPNPHGDIFPPAQDFSLLGRHGNHVPFVANGNAMTRASQAVDGAVEAGLSRSNGGQRRDRGRLLGLEESGPSHSHNNSEDEPPHECPHPKQRRAGRSTRQTCCITCPRGESI